MVILTQTDGASTSGVYVLREHDVNYFEGPVDRSTIAMDSLIIDDLTSNPGGAVKFIEWQQTADPMGIFLACNRSYFTGAVPSTIYVLLVSEGGAAIPSSAARFSLVRDRGNERNDTRAWGSSLRNNPRVFLQGLSVGIPIRFRLYTKRYWSKVA